MAREAAADNSTLTEITHSVSDILALGIQYSTTQLDCLPDVNAAAVINSELRKLSLPVQFKQPSWVTQVPHRKEMLFHTYFRCISEIQMRLQP